MFLLEARLGERAALETGTVGPSAIPRQLRTFPSLTT